MAGVSRVAVLDFTDAPGSDAGYSGKVIASSLAGNILDIPNWQIIERGKIDQILREQDFQRSGAVDTQTAVRMGKLLGADGVIVGTVSQYRIGSIPFLFMIAFDKDVYSVSFSFRLVRVETGDVVLTASSSATSFMSLEAAAQMASNKACAMIRRQMGENMPGGNAPGNPPADRPEVPLEPSTSTAQAFNLSRPGVALVIGIDKYQHAMHLKNAVSDARGVAQVLRSDYGFSVQELYDGAATRASIIGAIRKAAADMTEGQNLIIYYSGHGWEDEVLKEGYWVPCDAREQDPSGCVSNAELHKYISAMQKAQHVLLVSDSCFSGDFLMRSIGDRDFGKRHSGDSPAMLSGYFQKLDNQKSRMALTSGKNEPVPDGGREGHSVFGYYFLRALAQPDRSVFTAGELVQRVSEAVGNNSSQTPLSGTLKNAGHEGGQMVFVKRSAEK